MFRKRLNLLFLSVLITAGCAPSFQVERLREHVSFLADDRQQGRGLGTRGIEASADYIAGQFRAAGLNPAGENGTFYQSFEVILGQKLTGRPSLSVAGAPALGVLWRDFVTLPFSSSESFNGPVAFVGYGISNEKVNYDDYAGFDAKGKVLLMFRYEPRGRDTEAEFGGKKRSRHSLFLTKAQLARRMGAKALLIVNPLDKEPAADRLFAFDLVEHDRDHGIPMMHVSRRFADALLAAAGAASLADLQASIETSFKPRSMDLPGLTARGNPGIVRERAHTRNVIGAAPGSGRLADEYVVIGAHYDHLGIRVPHRIHASAKAEGKPEIHNGADDNASGTASLIELARAIRSAGGQRRGVLFTAFSAEEIGLIGSDYFVNHPGVPLDSIVAMINLDMVGRLRNNQIQVLGIKTGAEFETLIQREAADMGMILSSSKGGFGPSDHTSFYKKKIPVMHFFTGLHEDYHQPSDDTEKINFDGQRMVTELVYRVAMQLITSPLRPTYVAVVEKTAPRAGLKVRMGILPSYVDDERPGMRIDGISPGTPAERAGLLEGDQLLLIDEYPVNDVYDLMDALARYEPGNKAVVTLLRAGERIKLQITFEQP